MVSLILMPLFLEFCQSFEKPLEEVFPVTQLRLTSDYRIYNQFSSCPYNQGKLKEKIKIQTHLLPENVIFQTHDEEKGWIETRDDGQGKINWVYAKEIKTLTLEEDTSVINKAVMAYINCLPDDVRVILWWD